jgi:hypothetical protein
MPNPPEKKPPGSTCQPSASLPSGSKRRSAAHSHSDIPVALVTTAGSSWVRPVLQTNSVPGSVIRRLARTDHRQIATPRPREGDGAATVRNPPTS